ncbi:glycosyltransferase [Anaerocolumna sp. AGMB13025]|uniref:glycosyltransferase n=1 Tax=Anaerocolumna sp. AGMB13025 TaxID=3039116 RepID=UPI00241C1370|nr:glycosyltransferase [Anaerocolumna sp. AGMB13025]WFR56779.1 glycosyltransferase [Anaerocolumna sp. AGMB13025]
MITISACLIVKNEEKILARCLDSLKDIADEIIIIDTGSKDRTKEIAFTYTDQVFDYIWADDFSSARNFSFSKASMEYIYAADADEVIDTENRNKFMQLKQSLLPEIEIVQMLYTNQLQHNTTYNFDTEYRPKLYKRVRNFYWIDPIHESVALEPVIYNSEIEIIHLPEDNHGQRDFGIFQKIIGSGKVLSAKVQSMYARELFITGTEADFLAAECYFEELSEQAIPLEQLKQVQCILVRCGVIKMEPAQIMKYALKNISLDKASAEVCYDVGEYYFRLKDYKEATIWFYNAAYETESDLNIHYSGNYPLERLALCYKELGIEDQANTYYELAKTWTL